MLKFKSEIHAACVKIVKEKIDLAEKELQTLDSSQASETKSSMGDKYETSREMMQRERDTLNANLQNNKTILSQLQHIDLAKTFTKAETGSLIETEQGFYFLSVGLGKVLVNNHNVFVVSALSPIGKLLIGNGAGSIVTFNGQKLTLKEIG
jgi:hypothetical protein